MTLRIVLALPFLLALTSCTSCSGDHGSRNGPRERAGAGDKRGKKPKKHKKHRLEVTGEAKKYGERLKFTEGPAANRAGELYFSDFQKDQILRIDPESDEVSVFLQKVGGPQGLMFDGEDRLWIALEYKRAIARLDEGEKITVVADRWQGKRFNGPVDLVLDSKGGVYFADPWFKNYAKFKGADEGRDIDVEAVYHIAPDGTVTQLIANLVKPAGVLLSLDESTLYVTDYSDGALMAYPIEEDRSKVGKGKVVSFELNKPNGMAIDTDGRIYVAAAGGVHLFDESGKPDGTIDSKVRMRNVGFGGADRNFLYLAGGANVWRHELRTTGATPHIPDLMKELLAKKKDAGTDTKTDAKGDKKDDAKGEKKDDAKGEKKNADKGEKKDADKGEKKDDAKGEKKDDAKGEKKDDAKGGKKDDAKAEKKKDADKGKKKKEQKPKEDKSAEGS